MISPGGVSVIRVSVTDWMYFVATAPCGCGWTGMRHTDDVKIIIDRAMDHDHDAQERLIDAAPA